MAAETVLPPSPTVSVIIPHYNDLEGLQTCLRALAQQTYPLSRVEIIVADNNSRCGLEQVRAVAGQSAMVILAEEQGAGPARNAAVARSSNQILAFTDSDCVPERGWLEAGVRALQDYDFVGGHVSVLVGDEMAMTPTEAFERVFAFDFKTYIEKKGFTGSGNLFCARSLFDHVGGFRVGISEDYEWSKRAQSFGYRLGYAPLAVVGHPARRDWSELTRKWRRLNVETYGLSEGRPGRRFRWLMRSLLLPASAIVHTPRVLLSRKLHTAAQRLGGVCVLYAIRVWRMIDALKLLLRDSPASRPSNPATAHAERT